MPHPSSRVGVASNGIYCWFWTLSSCYRSTVVVEVVEPRIRSEDSIPLFNYHRELR